MTLAAGVFAWIFRVNLAGGIAGLRVSSGSDGAGVHDNDVGAASPGRGSAAPVEQLPLERGAVRLRGAAAELFDVEGRHSKPQKQEFNTERTEPKKLDPRQSSSPSAAHIG